MSSHYDATVTLKFHSTYTPSYNSYVSDRDFLPEENIEISVPAADLNTNQYFKLFEKFLLGVGMQPSSIRSGAMSLVFNDWVNESEQREVCEKYELTMNEDLMDKFEDYKKTEKEWERLRNTPVYYQGDFPIDANAGDFYTHPNGTLFVFATDNQWKIVKPEGVLMATRFSDKVEAACSEETGMGGN